MDANKESDDLNLNRSSTGDSQDTPTKDTEENTNIDPTDKALANLVTHLEIPDKDDNTSENVGKQSAVTEVESTSSGVADLNTEDKIEMSDVDREVVTTTPAEVDVTESHKKAIESATNIRSEVSTNIQSETAMDIDESDEVGSINPTAEATNSNENISESIVSNPNTEATNSSVENILESIVSDPTAEATNSTVENISDSVVSDPTAELTNSNVENISESVVSDPTAEATNSTVENISDSVVSDPTAEPTHSNVENISESVVSGDKDNMDTTTQKELSSHETSKCEEAPTNTEKTTDVSSSNLDADDDNAMDITEFVNADKENLERTDNIQHQENDPIASESSSNTALEIKSTEADDTIIPDSNKESEELEKTSQIPKDTDELYIVIKTSEKSTHACMECNTNTTPMYKCSFGSKTLYVCAENCLKVLKEKKAEKVIVRDLRVKIFASEGLRGNLPEIGTAEETRTDNTIPKCCECKSVVTPTSISWNTFNFCNEICLSAYQKKCGTHCVECKSDIQDSILGRYSVRFGKDIKQFCKNTCLLDHKKGQKFCALCQGEVILGQEYNNFCSKRCFEASNSIKNKITGPCSVCAQEKELEIRYKDSDQTTMFCSEPCFVAYKFVNKVNAEQCEFCKIYKSDKLPLLLFYYGGAKHVLCSADCRKLYIITTRKIVHCAWCNVKKYNFDMIQFEHDNTQNTLCSLNCYYLYKSGCDFCHKDTKPLFHITTTDGKVHNFCSSVCLSLFRDGLSEFEKDESPTEASTDVASVATNGSEVSLPPPLHPILRPVKKIVVVRPRPIPKQRNMTTMCKPYQITKSINCRPKESTKSCQTDPHCNKFLVPIPVPIYVPTPVCMYSLPVPCPLPIPIPIPVPIFIPTGRKSIKGIMKEMTKIKNKVPADPLEAELLMMAEMVAEDKKDESDSDSDEEPVAKETTYNSEPEQMDTNNSFGEDVLQMALKMASDFEEPVDLEGAVSASTISAGTSEDSAQRIGNIMETKRRSIRQARQSKRKPVQAQQVFTSVVPPTDMEKPDSNMCLKYTFGVNAWKQWVTTKNIELQKTSKCAKLFKTEILQLTADELNYSLCLFVKEVRKPNGAEYAPDTIYYLCLGIQQYLYENGRVDNIFCDTFYEKFTDCLNEVCQKFCLLYNESQYIVTRVEEEHLWESKQLGAHSPLVLLNTLMFFNTKHFSLTTIPEHLQLSFSHIMKHWKRNPNQPGSRNVLLRFYLPQTAEGSRKKKVYEQQENEDNPLRCPVKLYEFYLSKCPESVKTRNDVFYLQPERSCVPDSPVWYSTMAIGTEHLEKMLSRVKMIKEINVAILTT